MFIIPMVGKSSRFFNEGYTEPKYKLMVDEQSVFEHAVRSFEKYFTTDKFLFLVRSDYNAAKFVELKASELGISNFKIVEFFEETLGQADTVFKGLNRSEGFYNSEDDLYIFNIDTFRPGFTKQASSTDDGYLEVFEGEGSHWSFVEPGENFSVIRTTEKDRISNLCSDGLYYFKSASIFIRAFEDCLTQELRVLGEYFIAPMYNNLISNGLSVSYRVIPMNEVVFCGTPQEYRILKQD